MYTRENNSERRNRIYQTIKDSTSELSSTKESKEVPLDDGIYDGLDESRTVRQRQRLQKEILKDLIGEPLPLNYVKVNETPNRHENKVDENNLSSESHTSPNISKEKIQKVLEKSYISEPLYRNGIRKASQSIKKEIDSTTLPPVSITSAAPVPTLEIYNRRSKIYSNIARVLEGRGFDSVVKKESDEHNTPSSEKQDDVNRSDIKPKKEQEANDDEAKERSVPKGKSYMMPKSVSLYEIPTDSLIEEIRRRKERLAKFRDFKKSEILKTRKPISSYETGIAREIPVEPTDIPVVDKLEYEFKVPKNSVVDNATDFDKSVKHDPNPQSTKVESGSPKEQTNDPFREVFVQYRKEAENMVGEEINESAAIDDDRVLRQSLWVKLGISSILLVILRIICGVMIMTGISYVLSD